MVNVLSIDWDYFINADFNTRATLFPDTPNEGYGSYVQDSIWQSRYAGTSLKKVGIDTPALEKVKDCLNNNAPYAKVMMTRSHKFAYDFLKDIDDEINLVNVDFHHDVYTQDLSALNCGNWLCKVMDEHKGKYTWVARETSDMDICLEYYDRLDITYDLDILQDYEWDMIFICRSDMWSPPHLDKEFSNLVKMLSKVAGYLKGETVLKESRYNNAFRKGVFTLTKLFEQARNSFKS